MAALVMSSPTVLPGEPMKLELRLPGERRYCPFPAAAAAAAIPAPGPPMISCEDEACPPDEPDPDDCEPGLLAGIMTLLLLLPEEDEELLPAK